jgi:Ca2+-binding EF-hand superfamily protein
MMIASRAERAEAARNGLFSLFSLIDVNNNGSIDAEELHCALSTDPGLRARLASAVGMDPEDALWLIERAVMGRMDEDWDGQISAVEFDKILSGRTDWDQKPISDEERNQRRLKGFWALEWKDSIS